MSGHDRAGSVTGDPPDLAHDVERAAALARRSGAEAFEIRADLRDSRRVVLRNGVAQPTWINQVTGLGVRVFAGGGVGYAFAAETDDASIQRALDRAVSLARAQGKRRFRSFAPALRERRARYAPHVRAHPMDASSEDVVRLVQRAEEGAKETRPDLSVQTAFGARTTQVVVADSAGSWIELGSVVSTLTVQAVAKDGARFGDGTEWRGGERGLDDYEDRGGPEELGRETARNAVEAMDAVAFPGGRYRCLTDNHLTGLLAHESFGHLTEYDLVASGWSVLNGRKNERLAREMVTIRDAPVVEGKRGVAVPYDDEGTPGRDLKLLDKGVLASWMHTRDSAASEDGAPTGNGRALDSRFPPIVRMRNTFVEPGEGTVEEALELLGDGVYLIGGRGGAPRSDGSFMFTAKRGYTVKAGKVDKPVRSVSIHGNVLDFLDGVEFLTRDFEVHTNYFGGCGKWDQSFLHVGTGGPHVLVREALVGGQGE